MTTLTDQPTPSAQSPAQSIPAARRPNVSSTERLVSLGAGLTLLSLAASGRKPAALMLGAGAMLLFRAFTGRCPVYSALKIDHSNPAPAPEEYFHRGIHVEESFTIQRPPQELYDFWRKLDNLPRFMTHLRSVQLLDPKRSRWEAHAPAGQTVQWEAEIINEEPPTTLAWRSLDGATVANAGSVRFVDTGDRGTEVRVVLDYIPPAGRLGAMVAGLFGQEPSQQIREDLRKFKQLMEAGEIPTTEGQPSGTCMV